MCAWRAARLALSRARRHFNQAAVGLERKRMMMVANRGRAVLAAMLIAMAASGWGCLSPAAVNPPIVSVTPLGTAVRPAKPPDCAMPVLDSMPLTDHQQIALVDAWG